MPAKLKFVEQVHCPSIGYLPIQENGCTFKPSAKSREYKQGEKSEYGGFIEKGEGASLELTLNAQESLDMNALNAIQDENLTITLSSGEEWFMPNAWRNDPIELTKGQIKITFMSNTSEKLS